MKDWKTLPAHTRVWVYQSNRAFSNEEVATIRQLGNDFVGSWAAHGAALDAAIEVFYNRFIAIFVDEKQAMASGCSIDKSVGLVRSIQEDFSCELLDRMHVAYKKDGALTTSRLAVFQEMVESGTLQADTIVFNNLVATKQEFEERWEVPLQESWHKQMLPA